MYIFFGCIHGDEARTVLEEAQTTLEAWWRIFEENEDRLDDTDLMLDAIKRTVNPVAPDVEILSTKVKALYGLMRAWNTLARRPTPPFGDRSWGTCSECW